MSGIGVLATITPNAPAPAIWLASTESELSPNEEDPFWLFDGERSELIGVGGFVAPTPMALAAAPNVVPPAIGPGGWLIGNGLDALEIDPGCLDACDGGNGGLLWGTAVTARTAAMAVTPVCYSATAVPTGAAGMPTTKTECGSRRPLLVAMAVMQDCSATVESAPKAVGTSTN